MKLSHMMSRVGVRPRVFGGFALVLSFLVLLAGFAVVQVERIGGTVNDLVTSAAGDAGMSQARAALLEANSAVEKFIRTWNVGDKDAAAKAIDGVGKLADQADRQFGKLQAIAEGIGPVKTALETYRSSFPRRQMPRIGCAPPPRRPTPRARPPASMSAAFRLRLPIARMMRNGLSTRCAWPASSTRCASP